MSCTDLWCQQDEEGKSRYHLKLWELVGTRWEPERHQVRHTAGPGKAFLCLWTQTLHVKKAASSFSRDTTTWELTSLMDLMCLQGPIHTRIYFWLLPPTWLPHQMHSSRLRFSWMGWASSLGRWAWLVSVHDQLDMTVPRAEQTLTVTGREGTRSPL